MLIMFRTATFVNYYELWKLMLIITKNISNNAAYVFTWMKDPENEDLRIKCSIKKGSGASM